MPTRIHRLPPLPVRPADGHKGLFGRVLVIGGSDTMLGAPVLSGTAALRVGSGLVQIHVPPDLLHHALAITPELIGTASSAAALSDAVDSADVLIVGPGMGKVASAKKLLMHLIEQDKPIVIDADALNMLAEEKSWPTKFKARGVLTPHPGEMKRLIGLLGKTEVPKDERGRIDLAVETASAFKQLIVLKGQGTVVTDGSQVYVNRTGDSSLSKAGSGDVLTGVIGSLIGQGMTHFDAAVAGTWIHGRAGELAGQQLGQRSVLARDVIDHLHEAIGQYETGA